MVFYLMRIYFCVVAGMCGGGKDECNGSSTDQPGGRKARQGRRIPPEQGTDNFNGRVITVNAGSTPSKWSAWPRRQNSSATARWPWTVRLTLEVQGIPYEKIEPFRPTWQKGA